MVNIEFAKLLQLFAELFKFPEKNLHAAIKNGDFDAEIAGLSQLAGLAIGTDFQAKMGSYEEFVQSFNNCFLGKRNPFAPPVESVYKIWTTDQSYQITHKNQTGYLMSDSALHIKYILDALSLEIPQEYAMMPDHLAILLEIYAFLQIEGMRKEADSFLKDHLDWLPALFKNLQQIENADFYLYTVAKLEQLLAMASHVEIN